MGSESQRQPTSNSTARIFLDAARFSTASRRTCGSEDFKRHLFSKFMCPNYFRSCPKNVSHQFTKCPQRLFLNPLETLPWEGFPQGYAYVNFNQHRQF